MCEPTGPIHCDEVPHVRDRFTHQHARDSWLVGYWPIPILP
jgi:hypothetical protein